MGSFGESKDDIWAKMKVKMELYLENTEALADFPTAIVCFL